MAVLNGSIQQIEARALSELSTFRTIWQGGYFEGDPLDPMAPSTYGLAGYMSILHAVHLACIKPYVTPETVALEIGPGRGAFTRAILQAGAREVWAVDALSADHNGFWQYIGRDHRVRYEVATDFTLSMIQDGTIDYLFSFGCFCHISPPLVGQYVESLSRVMHPGARGFLMIADYAKANACRERLTELSALRILESEAFNGRRYLPLRLLVRALTQLIPPQRTSHLRHRDPDEDHRPSPGRRYDLGTDRACAMLESRDFEIIDCDMDICKRDPIIHFMRR